MPGIWDKVRNAWNAFRSNENEDDYAYSGSASYGRPPTRSSLNIFNERSLIASIYNRLSTDVSGLVIKHVKTDEQDRYAGDMNSGLNMCLTWDPNLDQDPRSFRQDIAMTLFDQGVAAVVPVDTSESPETQDSYEIWSLRVGRIVTWYPEHVRVSVYNEKTGIREEIQLEKKAVAIIENPFYSVMNEPNSTLQRLIRKLTLMDGVDEQISSGKLDIIIQLPYVIKSEARRQQAVARREDIEFQLRGSQYGIAYIDGTEKITQLNRPAENTLLNQIEYLVKQLYTQLGLTEEIMNGTANEETMLNYFNRTIEPIADAIVESMRPTFIGPAGLKKHETIMYFRDPFKLVPVNNIAEIADKFTRNEILTANEVRSFIGMPPASDPKADQLVNSNMPQPTPPNQQPNPPLNPQDNSGPTNSERNGQNGTRFQRVRN